MAKTKLENDDSYSVDRYSPRSEVWITFQSGRGKPHPQPLTAAEARMMAVDLMQAANAVDKPEESDRYVDRSGTFFYVGERPSYVGFPPVFYIEEDHEGDVNPNWDGPHVTQERAHERLVELAQEEHWTAVDNPAPVEVPQ